MIRHIVMFRLREYPTAAEKQKAAGEVLDELRKLPEKIHVIRSFEAGANICSDAWAFDIALDLTFDSEADLEIYRYHPDHQAFIAFNRNYSASKVVVDFVI